MVELAPLVSVIIPTYKRGGEFLKRAVRSVLNQTYAHIEVIVVDDNPPASVYRRETEESMEEFGAYHNVIYLQNVQNMGGGPARNKGIGRAAGEYITFLDDDDVYLPEKVGAQLRFMLDQDLDLSFTDVRIHNQGGKLVDYREHPYVRDVSNEELLKLHLMHHLTPTNTYMFRKEALTKIGGFDDVKMGQEFLLMLKAIERGLSIGYLPVAHVIQYLHEGERISSGENKIQGEMELFELKKGYFPLLNFRQRQYVKFRHHAVLMVVGKRSKRRLFALEHFVKALLSSPLDCFWEAICHCGKMRKFREIQKGQ